MALTRSPKKFSSLSSGLTCSLCWNLVCIISIICPHVFDISCVMELRVPGSGRDAGVEISLMSDVPSSMSMSMSSISSWNQIKSSFTYYMYNNVYSEVHTRPDDFVRRRTIWLSKNWKVFRTHSSLSVYLWAAEPDFFFSSLPNWVRNPPTHFSSADAEHPLMWGNSLAFSSYSFIFFERSRNSSNLELYRMGLSSTQTASSASSLGVKCKRAACFLSLFFLGDRTSTSDPTTSTGDADSDMTNLY